VGQFVNINTLHGNISAWRAAPSGSPKGAIIVVQEIFGVNHHIRSVADQFAAHGYLAIAPALYDLIEHDIQLNYDEAGITRGRALRDELGEDRGLDCIRAAMEEVEAEGFVGVVGYCWGGTLAYLSCARLGLPAVSYYGARTPQFLHESPSGPLMLHFGDSDASIPAEDIAKQREHLTDAEIHVWPAGHGFNCDERADYNAQAASDALRHTLHFFETHLQ
jgi:carboxymethylenebutenolidase